MAIRTLGTVLLMVLASGCASARPAAAVAGTAVPADPDRWTRVACQRGEYPVELDGRAFAQARWLDRLAERQGAPTPSATQRLLDQRSAFETRCASWLQVVQLQL
jgi:hypothetical protein